MRAVLGRSGELRKRWCYLVRRLLFEELVAERLLGKKPFGGIPLEERHRQVDRRVPIRQGAPRHLFGREQRCRSLARTRWLPQLRLERQPESQVANAWPSWERVAQKINHGLYLAERFLVLEEVLSEMQRGCHNAGALKNPAC